MDSTLLARSAAQRSPDCHETHVHTSEPSSTPTISTRVSFGLGSGRRSACQAIDPTILKGHAWVPIHRNACYDLFNCNWREDLADLRMVGDP